MNEVEKGNWESKVKITVITHYGDDGVSKREHIRSVRERILKDYRNAKVKFLKTKKF